MVACVFSIFPFSHGILWRRGLVPLFQDTHQARVLQVSLFISRFADVPTLGPQVRQAWDLFLCEATPTECLADLPSIHSAASPSWRPGPGLAPRQPLKPSGLHYAIQGSRSLTSHFCPLLASLVSRSGFFQRKLANYIPCRNKTPQGEQLSGL